MTRKNKKQKSQTDKEAYDIAQHFKEEHDRLTNIIKKQSREIKTLKKCIFVNYSFARVLDENSGLAHKVLHSNVLIEELRIFNSEKLDEFFFNNEDSDTDTDDDFDPDNLPSVSTYSLA